MEKDLEDSYTIRVQCGLLKWEENLDAQRLRRVKMSDLRIDMQATIDELAEEIDSLEYNAVVDEANYMAALDSIADLEAYNAEHQFVCQLQEQHIERQTRRIRELEARLLLIRDSTYRNATTLRAMADRALSALENNDND